MTTALEPPPTTVESPHRRRDIQGLRALAVVVVIVFHAGLPVPGGFIGVDIFFVISGFVITAMLMREWADTARVRFGQFYLRRFRRLTPALALMVSVTMVASFFLLSPLGPQETAAKTGLGAMLIVANFVISATTGGYFDAPAETNPLLNTWSLSVEEQFYLIFPALLALGWVIARRLSRSTVADRRHGAAPTRPLVPFVIVGLVAIVSFALTQVNSASGWLGFYSPFTRAWEFAIGALLALAAVRLKSTAVATVVGLIGLAMTLSSLWLITGKTSWPGYWTLLPTVGTLLLILAGSNMANPVSRAFGWRPFVAVGDASYSLYLWHWPFIVFAALLWPGREWILVAAALVSCIPAVLSYVFVEQPIRMSRKHPAILIAATLTPPLVLAGGLWFTSSQGSFQPTIQAYQVATMSHSAADENGCDQGIPAGEVPSSCIWNASAPGKPIILLGDSNAAHFSEALIGASTELDRPLTIAADTGCPFIDTKFTQTAFNRDQQKACRSYITDSLDWLDTQPPSTVVLSSSDRIWTSPGFTLLPSGVKGNTTEGRAILDEALISTVKRIQEAGHTVVLVQVVPHWTDKGRAEWDPTACTTFDIVNGNCQRSTTIEEAKKSHAASREAIDAAAAATGATVLDLMERMCPEGTCSTMRGDLFVYRDSTHITPEMSALLAPDFVAVLRTP